MRYKFFILVSLSNVKIKKGLTSNVFDVQKPTQEVKWVGEEEEKMNAAVALT